MPQNETTPASHASISGFQALLRRYREAFATPGFLLSATTSIGALLLSFVLSSFAVAFSSERASNSVTDLILSNTTALNVDGVYVYGAILLIVVIVALLIAYPKRVPFTLYALALFFVTRALFVTLTHLGPFELNSGSDFGTTIQHMFFGDDYFFSGHTGSPFLMALIYWRERVLRYVFLIWSIFFGAIVLLGHLHYSIDVFAAFYITFTVYCMARYLFGREYTQFVQDHEALS